MRKTLALLASAALMTLPLAARADTYTYSFTTNHGFDFNFTSSSLLTTYTNVLTSTSPAITNLSCSIGGQNCNDLEFTFIGNYNSFYLANSYGSSDVEQNIPSVNLTVGTHNINGDGTLTSTDVPGVAVAPTPEPSSLLLLGTAAASSRPKPAGKGPGSLQTSRPAPTLLSSLRNAGRPAPRTATTSHRAISTQVKDTKKRPTHAQDPCRTRLRRPYQPSTRRPRRLHHLHLERDLFGKHHHQRSPPTTRLHQRPAL